MIIKDKHLALLRWMKHSLLRYRRGLLIGFGLFFVIIIVLQLLYPSGKGLPLAHIGKQSIAFEEQDELSKKIQTLFSDASFTVQLNDKKVTSRLAEAGAELNIEAMVYRAVEYPLWQRFIPFSILLHQPDLAKFDVTFNDEQLNEYTKKAAQQLNVLPVDAGLTITDGKLVVTEPRNGYVVTPDALRQKITSTQYLIQDVAIQATATTVSPKRSMKDIEPVRTQAESYIAHILTLKGQDNKTIEVQPIDIAAWLSVEFKDNGEVVLVIKDEAVAAYVSHIAKQVDIAPGVARAKLMDGVETSRTTAPSGLGVNQARLAADLKAAVVAEASKKTILLAMGPVPPTVQYDRSYSSTRAGLQAYADYLGQSSNVRIAIAQLDGNGWSVGARENEGTISASTYKAFLSLVLFDKINSGEVHWSDPIKGYDMAVCLEKTIVVSANECAEELLGKFGRTNINNFLYARGISRTTTFTNTSATQTSAADLNRLMIGINNGTLLSGGDRSNLLDKMGRQVYRNGIPAGSKGSVQDKVGFLWDYLNDSAIVRHPKGTYAMTILTKGSSWGNIAQITRDVEGIMYP